MADLAGWTASNCTLTTIYDHGQKVLRVTRTGANPSITSPAGRGVRGKSYKNVRAKVRKVGGSSVATTFVGRLSWATSDGATHGFSASYKDELAAPSGKSMSQWFNLIWAPGDTPTAGGTDWTDSTIDQLRIEFSNDANAVWDVVEIGEGNYGATRNEGDLADLDQADTAQIAANAVTEHAFSFTSGSIGPGAVTIQTVTVVVTDAAYMPKVTLSADLSLNGTGNSFASLERSTNGGVASAVQGGSMTPKGASGDSWPVEKTISDPLAGVGSHAYTWKQAIGANHTWSNRLMEGELIKR